MVFFKILNRNITILCVIVGVNALSPALFQPANAQDRVANYPSKPIRIITGSAPGGPLDFSARLAAQKIAEAFGLPAVVEPRTGASGTIAGEYVAKSAPDGHTLGLGSMATLCVVPHLYPKIGYDSLRDFAPVIIVAAVDFLVVTHPSVPARHLKELIAIAKASPGKLSFGTAGAGSVTHLGIELLKSMAGVNFLHVPYKGAAPAMIDLIGGQVDLMYDSVLTAMPHARSGRIRAIALGSAQRSPLLPQIPTVAESGLPGFDASTWFGIVAPAATPRDIVNRLNATIVKGVSDKAVTQRLLDQGLSPVLNTPEDFSNRIKEDLPRWGKVIKAAGIKAN